MRLLRNAFLITAVLTVASCTGQNKKVGWVVEKMEIPLYHSTTRDEATGFFAHVEYCGAKLTRGRESVLVVYRPIDFSRRNPGFAEGDIVTVTGLESAKDFGAAAGRDYWIYDLKIAPAGNKPGG